MVSTPVFINKILFDRSKLHFLVLIIAVQIIAIEQIIAEQIIAILILTKFQKAVYMPNRGRTEMLSTDPGSKCRGASFFVKSLFHIKYFKPKYLGKI